MALIREDWFVRILGMLESSNHADAWGDDGCACGRFQIHPSMYLSWQPDSRDFEGAEHSWDWAFERAVRTFFRVALSRRPTATDQQIAMAFHLHGQVVWSGWDDDYAVRWQHLEDAYASERSAE